MIGAMPRPKQRTPELRDHIQVVAMDVLARDGVAGFTARNIASRAGTSTPALYELFGDRAGLLREVFFEGFRQMGREFAALDTSDDPHDDLLAMIWCYRAFLRKNRMLAELMFSHPFSDFQPSPDENAAGTAALKFVVGRVRRCVDAGILHGDPKDIAVVLDVLVQGLGRAETSGRLGKSAASIDRRWEMGIGSLLAGFGPGR
jgi:AcrR family transcriptional regulator